MNMTPLLHVVYALLMQGVVLLASGSAFAGGCFAVAWFVSREHAQRENQIARERGVEVESMKPWDGFTGWSRDRYLDAGLPAIACTALLILLKL